MCGRYTITTGPEEVRERFHLDPADSKGGSPQLPLTYNAAPGQQLPVISTEQPDKISLYWWGLVPHWAEDRSIGSKMINARAETLAEKPAFRKLLAVRRCLVLADGFYEWKKSKAGNQPFRIQIPTQDLFCFAGLWDSWVDKETGEEIRSFTIITTAANSRIRPLHERMPVILQKADEARWLKPDLPEAEAQAILERATGQAFKYYPVSQLVNSARNDGPELIEPVTVETTGDLFAPPPGPNPK